MKLGLEMSLALVFCAALVNGQNQQASISGTVLDSKGTPLRKANVTLLSLQSAQNGPRVGIAQPLGATTDNSGRFNFANVDGGSYTLAADHVGYLRGAYGAKGGGSGTVLTVQPGDQLTDLTIRLTEQAAITGKIVDEDGDPVANVQVRVMRKSYVSGTRQLVTAGTGNANDIGEFRVAGIAPGEYFLAAQPQQRAAARNIPQPILTYYPGATDPAGAVPLRVSAGDTLTSINLRIAKGLLAHVRGTVTGFTGNPGQARVSADGTRFGAGLASATINNEGHFDIAGLTQGSWVLTVVEARGQQQAIGRRTVEVNGQDVEDVVIAVGAPMEIHGSLKYEGPPDAGQPGSPRVSIVPFENPGVNPPGVKMDADGGFTFSSPGAGRYKVSVAGLGPTSYLKSVKVDGREAMGGSLEIGESGNVGNLEVVVSSPGAELFGVVLGPDGNSAAAIVTIAPEPLNSDTPDLFRRLNTDQNGKFDIKGIPPGSYRLYAWDHLEAGEQYDPDVLKTHLDKSVTATVSEGDKTVVMLNETVQ